MCVKHEEKKEETNDVYHVKKEKSKT